MDHHQTSYARPNRVGRIVSPSVHPHHPTPVWGFVGIIDSWTVDTHWLSSMRGGGLMHHRHAEMEKPSGGLEAAADITEPHGRAGPLSFESSIVLTLLDNPEI